MAARMTIVCPFCKGPHSLSRCPGWMLRGKGGLR